jgi:hypothetical protein
MADDPKAKKNKGGRPSKYDPKKNDEIRRLAAIGVPLKEIAYFLDINPVTATKWKDQHKGFANAIKKGDAQKKVSVYNALFKNAVESRNVAAQIFLAKNWLGMSDRQDLSLGTPDGAATVSITVVHTKSADGHGGNGNGNGDDGGHSK